MITITPNGRDESISKSFTITNVSPATHTLGPIGFGTLQTEDEETGDCSSDNSSECGGGFVPYASPVPANE